MLVRCVAVRRVLVDEGHACMEFICFRVPLGCVGTLQRRTLAGKTGPVDVVAWLSLVSRDLACRQGHSIGLHMR